MIHIVLRNDIRGVVQIVRAETMHDFMCNAGGWHIVEVVRKIVTDKNINDFRFQILVVTQ